MANIIKNHLLLSDRQEAERGTWQYRAVEATRGSQTVLGALVLAVIGQQRQTRPQFGGKAIILKSGHVMASMVDRNGTKHAAVPVCMVSELQDMFSRLADDLQLSDPDRIAMFGAVRQWITFDERVDTNLHFTKTR